MKAMLHSQIPFLSKAFAIFLAAFIFGAASVPAAADSSEGGLSGATRSYGKPLDVADPISAANGAYSFRMRPLELGGPFNLCFELFYRHDMYRWAALPEPFWFSPFAEGHVGFKMGDDLFATIYLPSGDQVSFQQEPSGAWRLTDPVVGLPGQFAYTDNLPQVRYEMVDTQGFVYIMDPEEQIVYIFEIWKTSPSGERRARVSWVADRNGNRLTYTYPDGETGNPSRVEDGLGRSLSFTYEKFSTYWSPVLTRVTDGGGRTVGLAFEERGADNGNGLTLRSIIDPLGRATLFSYAPDCYGLHRISAVRRPRGNVPTTQEYAVVALDGSDNCRVVSQTDAAGSTTALEYDGAENGVTESRPDGTKWRYGHFSSHGYPKAITDPGGKSASFTKTPEERLSSVKDREGNSTTFTHHQESGLLSSVTNPSGQKLSWTYAAQPQTFSNPANAEQVPFTFYSIARTDYPDGTSEVFTYDGRGNPVSWVDRAGKTWACEVDARGQKTRVVNPAGGEVLYTYNADGTLASSRDSGAAATIFTYDEHRRLSRTTNPGGSCSEFSYDLADQVTKATDELGNSAFYAYDANGNLVAITDPAGNVTTLTPDDMDRVSAIIRPGGATTSFEYDAAGRLSKSTGPAGQVESYRYDSLGHLSQVVDGAGQVWEWGYGNEGNLKWTRDPSGGTETYEEAENGWLGAIIDPLGRKSAISYDSMGRPTLLVDRAGRKTHYSYDALGLLSGVSNIETGLATYTRNSQGLPVAVADFKGGEWSYAYTPEGRLLSHGDPLGNLWGYSYDERGRLFEVSFPTGETASVTYDAADRETAWSYSGGASARFGYDALGRVTSADRVQIAYDPAGNVISTVTDGGDAFGASADAAGRLTSATYAGGLFSVACLYDGRGLLTKVEDSLTGSWVRFGYSAAGELVEVTRSNGISTLYERDGAGQISRISDGVAGDASIATQIFARNEEGEVTLAETEGALDPADSLFGSTESFSYDAANRVTSDGFSFDERGRCTASPSHSFEWDGAGRAISVDGREFAYNGLSDPVSIEAAGKTVHLHRNYALMGTAVAAESESGQGSYKRFYVWSPDGTLLYSMTPGGEVSFYHSDLTGSTLFLSGKGGGVEDRYAYSPHGALLKHEGSSDQPYTFCGRFGVRALATDLYLMGERIYDSSAGRFLSPDPSGINLSDPRSLNLYQYAAQDPVNTVDPFGNVGWNPDRTVYTSKTGQFVQDQKPQGNFLGGWRWVPNQKPRENPPAPEPKPPTKREVLDGQGGDPPQPAPENPPEVVEKALPKADPGRPKTEASLTGPPRSEKGDDLARGPIRKHPDNKNFLKGMKLDLNPLKKAALNIAEKIAIGKVKGLAPGAVGPGLAAALRLAAEAQKLLQVGKEMTKMVRALVEQRERIKRETGIDTADIYPGRRHLAQLARDFQAALPWLFR